MDNAKFRFENGYFFEKIEKKTKIIILQNE